uniref:Calpain catalytic domain-containing protein n=1 Tax=Chromera velia CCMP2878 TaxID=1169474 RepID=A0A0G4H9C2_9ALVE|eukprot:Cvel_25394.t1-p1 / transcript=Cvel_25394.t1 / gene=Cvel_25394 / organism=Chromera_velia_CCMP2878 / gene_product=hypothetical protein / transcript_product=hypothetical protein / location=Cvel_scaffold2871:15685-18682(+) / protein_length=668 / sequence_SO=supercontig / SO=protein_coding / is_pseudo=false
MLGFSIIFIFLLWVGVSAFRLSMFDRDRQRRGGVLSESSLEKVQTSLSASPEGGSALSGVLDLISDDQLEGFVKFEDPFFDNDPWFKCQKDEVLRHAIELPYCNGRLFDSARADYFRQCGFGNCGFHCALIALRRAGEDKVRDLIRETEVSGDGKYHVRLWNYMKEEWVEVEVDDRVPVHAPSGEIRRTLRPMNGPLWPVVIEKAAAKILGSWKAFSGIPVELAWAMLTGDMQFNWLQPKDGRGPIDPHIVSTERLAKGDYDKKWSKEHIYEPGMHRNWTHMRAGYTDELFDWVQWHIRNGMAVAIATPDGGIDNPGEEERRFMPTSMKAAQSAFRDEWVGKTRYLGFSEDAKSQEVIKAHQQGMEFQHYYAVIDAFRLTEEEHGVNELLLKVKNPHGTLAEGKMAAAPWGHASATEEWERFPRAREEFFEWGDVKRGVVFLRFSSAFGLSQQVFFLGGEGDFMSKEQAGGPPLTPISSDMIIFNLTSACNYQEQQDAIDAQLAAGSLEKDPYAPGERDFLKNYWNRTVPLVYAYEEEKAKRRRNLAEWSTSKDVILKESVEDVLHRVEGEETSLLSLIPPKVLGEEVTSAPALVPEGVLESAPAAQEEKEGAEGEEKDEGEKSSGAPVAGARGGGGGGKKRGRGRRSAVSRYSTTNTKKKHKAGRSN